MAAYTQHTSYLLIFGQVLYAMIKKMRAHV